MSFPDPFHHYPAHYNRITLLIVRIIIMLPSPSDQLLYHIDQTNYWIAFQFHCSTLHLTYLISSSKNLQHKHGPCAQQTPQQKSLARAKIRSERVTGEGSSHSKVPGQVSSRLNTSKTPHSCLNYPPQIPFTNRETQQPQPPVEESSGSVGRR